MCAFCPGLYEFFILNLNNGKRFETTQDSDITTITKQLSNKLPP